MKKELLGFALFLTAIQNPVDVFSQNASNNQSNALTSALSSAVTSQAASVAAGPVVTLPAAISTSITAIRSQIQQMRQTAIGSSARAEIRQQILAKISELRAAAASPGLSTAQKQQVQNEIQALETELNQ